MKILNWFHTYYPTIGGIEIHSAQLMTELETYGHTFTVVTNHSDLDAPDQSTHQGIPVHRFHIHRAVAGKDLKALIRIRSAIRNLVQAFQPDLIHLHPDGPELLIYLQVCKSLRLPTLVTMHNNYASRGLDLSAQAPFGIALRRAEQVSTVADDVRRWLVTEIPEIESNTIVIRNGVPERDILPLPLPWDPPRLIYAGRLAEQKRLDVLLHAFPAVRSQFPEVQLRILGDGPECTRLKALAAELDIEAAVEFRGFVEHRELIHQLNKATIFVMSSSYEGLPNAAIEAAQMGRPIVATRAGGMAELVQHSRTGLLVDREDPNALAKALKDLLSDPERAAGMGRLGEQRVKAHFDMTAVAAAYDRIYRRTASQGFQDAGIPAAHP
jgi:glycogen(starch) synthase